MAAGQQWYKNAIMYAVDIESFRDSNGDGVGDLSGFIQSLDYLAALGINCIWILPFYPSSDGDNGYDITDHYLVESRLGSLGDIAEMLREATKRGIRVFVDLVVQHTSDQHPWFQGARADPESPYRNFYIWRDEPLDDPQQTQIVYSQDEHDLSAWTYDETAGAYYLHHFYDFEPDLNLCDPRAEEEVHKIISFWLQLGVSGFRIDAAPYLGSQDATAEAAGTAAHPILRRMRDVAANQRGDSVLLGEVDAPLEELADYFSNGDELHMLFNFYLNNYLFLALARGKAEPIARALRCLPSIPRIGQWVNWVRNYDELDLERLSDAEREEVFQAFAPDESMRIYERGIRRRLPPMVNGDRRCLELVYSLIFSLPGTPCLFMGEEIGMGEDLSLEGRTSVRTPMQWSDEPNGGFSMAHPDNLVRPVISEGQFDYRRVNVADQRLDPNSFLNWMQRLISVRRASPVIGWGDFHILETSHENVLAHTIASKGERIVAFHNLAGHSCSVTVEADETDGDRIREIFNDGEYEEIKSLVNVSVELHPYGYRWFHNSRVIQ